MEGTANLNVEKVVNPVKPDKRNSGFFLGLSGANGVR